ncbi:MAG: DUF1465 family protein [Geminicoccaceae bacterium]
MRHNEEGGIEPQLSIAVLDALLDEAVDLSKQTRSFLAQPRSRSGDPMAELLWVQETTRLSARLGHSVAWILARKACHSGEITVAALREDRWRLGGAPVCAASHDDDERIPEGLVILLQKSHALYQRLERLDQMTADAGARPTEDPVAAGRSTLVH